MEFSIFTNIVEIRSIILEIVQNGHDGAFLVVRKQRLKADVLERDEAALTVAPHSKILYFKLKIKHLNHTSLQQPTSTTVLNQTSHSQALRNSQTLRDFLRHSSQVAVCKNNSSCYL